jgi:hypothetical protein
MLKIDKFLWCHEDTHDKYWGWILTPSGYINFWGRRGNKKITFKRYPDDSKLRSLCREKINNKNYKDYTDYDKIERFFPKFHKEFEIQLTLAKLGDIFHGEK